jgi:HD superfamily phosphohydrolase
MIQVNDILYGNVTLPAVFQDLMNTSIVKRLAGIHQSGALFLVNPDLSHSRLEHSIGVMLLIRKMGGTELEQVAGLLHDLSHTAFSHVADYVFENRQEDYHENIFADILLQSELPDILEKHGYTAQQIMANDFSILEQELPHLCADRVDYTLRDSVHARLISRLEAKNFLEHLSLSDGKMVVKDEDQALWINDLFKRLNTEVFNLPLYLYANQEMASIIRKLLKTGFLTEADLFKDDTFLLNKIRSNSIGYEAVKAIKQHKGYTDFLRKGATISIKSRDLDALKRSGLRQS